MANFSIEGFAAGCKLAMANTNDRRQAARQYLEQTIQENDLTEIVNTLEAAIPKNASIGEMIIHTSPELTMLYARVPARFQSGIHNHTVFACIGQLTGTEISTLYNKTDDGKGLTVAGTLTANAGEVMTLDEDAIHHIENPDNETASSLHIYGGDFNAVMDERSLWDFDNHEEKSFSFPSLIQESIKGMKRTQNQQGLEALVKAIPSVRPMIDASHLIK
jgi:predicted metal-dependent enzyme (double-stranded beta helix superfamily)